jgi:hypothetical protein
MSVSWNKRKLSKYNGQLFYVAVLKETVDFRTMLICVEGARLLQEDGTGETPQAL